MKTIISLLAFLYLGAQNLSCHGQANVLPNGSTTLSNFQKIKVSQESTFQGKVILDSGLIFLGNALFSAGIYGEGPLTINGFVKFPGLPNSSNFDYLICGNTSGELSRFPFNSLSEKIQHLNPKTLDVSQLITLNGTLNLGNDLVINGEPSFSGNIITQQNLKVNGDLNLAHLAHDFNDQNPVLLAIRNDGTLIPVNGPIINAPKSNNCQTEFPIPSFWESSPNKIVTDLCSKDVKVGIGTQSPAHSLDVFGNISARGIDNFTQTNSTASIFLGDGAHHIKATKGKGMSFSTYNVTDGLFISESGNIGIGGGLLDPIAKLQITATSTNLNDRLFLINGVNGPKFLVTNDGKTYTNEVNVKIGDFPDYVFDASYSLQSLSELRKYISINRKLPKIPSAKEVAKKGADLGELNRLLLEKVEELTLYVLELESRISQIEGNKNNNQ